MTVKNDEIYKDSTFRGNQHLKKSNEIAFISQDDFVSYTKEIVKCAKDPIYFANNYYTIVSPAKGKHIIETYEKQKNLINFLVNENRAVVLSARQTGKTTSYCIFALWLCCFNEDKKILILANKESAAIEFLSRIRLAFELLPKWLKPGIKEGGWNKSRIEFSNGCSIEGGTTSADSARGKSCNCLIIDEAAFVAPHIISELWSSVYPIISSTKNSKCILVSTPNGANGLYYELYSKAEKNISEDGWKHFRIDWWDVPGRDENWKRQQIESLNDIVKFNQEFGNVFLGSSYTLINPDIIQKIKTKLIQHPREIIRDDVFKGYDVKVYYKPEKNHTYVIGGDVCDGVGGDYSVCKVFDISVCTNIKEVASFRSNSIKTSEFAYILAKIGTYYNRAYMMIESNNMGRSTIEFLSIIYEYEKIAKIGGKDLGVFSNNKLKISACINFKRFFDCENLEIDINEPKLLEEIEYFEKVRTPNGSETYRASSGKNDDEVMATIWAFYILFHEYIEYFYEVRFTTLGYEKFPLYVKDFSDEYYDKYAELKKLDTIFDVYKKSRPKYNNDFPSLDESEELKQMSGIENESNQPRHWGFFSN